MKTRYALILLLSSVVWGQNPQDQVNKDHPTPLVCGKYQHEQKTAAHCASQCPDGVACITSCLYVPEFDECVDDVHLVTEAEWQAILDRLNALESPSRLATTTGLVETSCGHGRHWQEIDHDKWSTTFECKDDRK